MSGASVSFGRENCGRGPTGIRFRRVADTGWPPLGQRRRGSPTWAESPARSGHTRMAVVEIVTPPCQSTTALSISIAPSRAFETGCAAGAGVAFCFASGYAGQARAETAAQASLSQRTTGAPESPCIGPRSSAREPSSIRGALEAVYAGCSAASNKSRSTGLTMCP